MSNSFSIEMVLRKRFGEVVILPLPKESAPRLEMDSLGVVKTRLEMNTTYADPINRYFDVVIPHMVQDGVRTKLGEYFVVNDSESTAEGVTLRSWTCFDKTQVVRRKKAEKYIYIAAGTSYTAAIGALLTEVDTVDYELDPSDSTLAIDREGWELGTSYLDIVNELLNEIDYHSLYMGMSGALIGRRRQAPTADNATKFYSKNQADGIVLPGGKRNTDNNDQPNVFYYSCENPERSTWFSAYAENANPYNAHSIINAPRNPVYKKLDNIANAATLKSKVELDMFESMASSEEIAFSTGLAAHSVFEVVALEKDIFTGVVQETGWSMDLSPGGVMQHSGLRMAYL